MVHYELTSWNFTGCTEENQKLSIQVVNLRADIGKGTSVTRSVSDNHSTATCDGPESLGA